MYIIINNSIKSVLVSETDHLHDNGCSIIVSLRVNEKRININRTNYGYRTELKILESEQSEGRINPSTMFVLFLC